MNIFTEKPELPPIVISPVWECPITGLRVPKDPTANLQWRAKLLADADNDPDFQAELYTACSNSILFWVNAFVFTVRVKETDDTGKEVQADNVHLPFVTWPHIQDGHILRIEHCIDEGESLLTDKSRDMGATWDHIVCFVHRLLFRPDESHLMISRKEDAVDSLTGLPRNYPYGPLADPGTLFGKIDYILRWLPEWMVPQLNRKKLHVVNLANGSRIDGESANATAGSSDRRRSILLDEFAKVDEAEAIKRSTKDVTACRLPCSTPNGAGTTHSKWRMSGQIPVFTLPWWEHPEKGKDRYVAADGETGRWKIRSPWYDRRCAEDSAKEIAIELDMDHVGSGDTFFESHVIEQHKRLYARSPMNQFTLSWDKNLSDQAMVLAISIADCRKIKRTGKGAWRSWVALNEDGRPDQTRTYTLGVDIGQGQGASNSVCSIMCDETREKIAEFASAEFAPYEFARIVCAGALWCGGSNKLPLICWENNGTPGFDFGKQLVHTYHYPNIYYHRQVGTIGERVGKRYGWRSSPEAKADALGALRRAYAHGGFRNHSAESLDEALTYITYPSGGIGPAGLIEESESARLAHGDRVIADMLCLVPHAPQPRAGEAAYKRPDLETFGGRMKAWQERQKGIKAGKRFNFDTEEIEA